LQAFTQKTCVDAAYGSSIKVKSIITSSNNCITIAIGLAASTPLAGPIIMNYKK
jgi:hypothetical protein